LIVATLELRFELPRARKPTVGTSQSVCAVAKLMAVHLDKPAEGIKKIISGL
jgi:hypothetical protein